METSGEVWVIMLFQLKNGRSCFSDRPGRHGAAQGHAGLPAKGDEFTKNIGILFADLEPIAGNVILTAAGRSSSET